MKEMLGGCCVCSDDRGWSENPLVYCDGQSCTVAVHQACYGIVTVPTGPWYCRKCESQERSVKVKCELCPSRYGALKRTDNAGWAHVVCALYIPEVRFGNVTTMEPIQLQLIPQERFNKLCYICQEKGKVSSATVGACMQCNRAGCKQQFHVTCAQGLGLLCEEAGNYLDNVKYCGYCQYHYSKLKKGGNVKTIPPYKPISNENHLSDSNSDKDGEIAAAPSTAAAPATTTAINTNLTNSNSISSTTAAVSTGAKPSTSPATATPPAPPPPTSSSSSSKRKSSSSSKSSGGGGNSSKTTSSSNSSSKSTSGGQKTNSVHSSNSSGHKSGASSDKRSSGGGSSSSKSGSKEDSGGAGELDSSKKDIEQENISTSGSHHSSSANKTESKEKSSGSSKKRKSNSRTPTPVGSVVDSSAAASDKKSAIEALDKLSKKTKLDTTQSILSNQPVVALTSISTIKSISPAAPVADIASASHSDSSTSQQPNQHSSIIQSAQTPQQPVNSLVVSVPLSGTSLSPLHGGSLLSNQTSVLTANTITSSVSVAGGGKDVIEGGNNSEAMITGDNSGGGLKIAYEKQDSIRMEMDMELEVPVNQIEVPVKRGRSQSNDKTERSSGRGKKRNSGSNGVNNSTSSSSAQLQTTNNNLNTAVAVATTTNKRSSRSQHSTPPPGGAFSSISQTLMKDSPPSSPSSESQGAMPASRGRTKGRKCAPAATGGGSGGGSCSKDVKDVKLFQNGVAITAPHMLGNQLNPNSNMAQKMSDHLNSELEAHSIFNANDNNSNLVGPQLHHRVIASARASSSGGSSTASGASGLSSMLGGGIGTAPQTLDQLLERQWEQGSQFLMEQAQHFDIASLLSCLHQLRSENLQLEEHVSSLLQRRDHLLAVNARLAIPLTGQPAAPQSTRPYTVNNIHPAVATASHSEMPRPSRHSGGGSGGYPSHPQQSGSAVAPPIENGLPTEQSAYFQHPHRSPVGGQPSPTVRHSPAPGYTNSSLSRQSADTSGRSAPRPQPYPLYQTGAGPSQTSQVLMRRDGGSSDLHHHHHSSSGTSTKPPS